MSDIIKAGVPHPVVVNSKADKLGFEAGFKMHYVNAATNAVTEIPANSFSEIEKDITPTSTTLSGDHVAGAKTITVADVTGFGIGETVKISGVYYRVAAVDAGANTIELKRGLDGAVVDGTAVDLNGRTGSYVAMVTFPDAGDFTGHVSNPGLGMDNEAFPIRVGNATVEDVSDAIAALQVDLTAVKGQVDTLDEEELNGISEKVDVLSSNLEAVHTLIKDTSDVYVEISGDETGNIAEGDVLTGDTSAATGTVQYVVYDATNDVTKVTMQSTSGTFQTGETVNNGTTSTTGTIASTENNVVNSVIEFVEEIKELLGSESGLDTLKSINNDLEHMLKGDATLEDGSANPTAGKGLTQIFDEIVATHTDVTAVKDLAEDALVGFSAIKTAVTDARTSIEGKLDALVDTNDADSLLSKLLNVESIVTANSALLTDSDYGLSKIKDGITALSDSVDLKSGQILTAIDGVNNSIDTLNTAVTQLSTDIADQTTHIDGKFDDVLNTLSDMNDTRVYTVFA